jgi:hypothetical protein
MSLHVLSLLPPLRPPQKKSPQNFSLFIYLEGPYWINL